jgi:hypothetical protein
VKLLAALSRVASPPKSPTPRAQPFDDGLVELARLIAREVPAADAEAGPDIPSRDNKASAD